MECGYYNTTIWEFDHFAPANGKYIGISPREVRYTTDRIAELKSKYGFSYIILWGIDDFRFNKIFSAGFTKDKIMLGANHLYYRDIIDRYGDVYAYYYDEPVSDGLPLTTGQDIRNYLDQKGYFNTKVGTGDYKGNSSFQYTVSFCNFAMFTAEREWWELAPGVWVSCCPVNWDQRTSWTTWKNIFSNKFSQTWVYGWEDLDEYAQLFGHAANLNMTTIWLWQDWDATDDYDNTNIMAFCNAATYAGFLKRFSKQAKLYYECIVHPHDGDCVCYWGNPHCYWQLIQKVYTGAIREG